MTRRAFNRRKFLAATGAAAAAIGAPAFLRAMPSKTLGIACVGVGGKGESDLRSVAPGHRVVGLCDVDAQRLAKAAGEFPEAKTFADWRRLLELDGIDAVTVSTPDHMHAAVTLAALERGKHVYTQKPLTNTIEEARRLTEAAAKQAVATQMGIQHHSSARIRAAVQLIRDGAIGAVREAHAWTDRPGNYWTQDVRRPEGGEAPPEGLAWDLWLGVAAERPYVPGLYHPFRWRAWWDFGTGALGDMGCHLLDPVVHALELGAPRAVSAEGPTPNPESGPLWCVVSYEFPGTKHTTDSVKVVWYEAGRKPPADIFLAPADWPGSANGVLFVGAKGNLFVGFPEPPQLFPVADFANVKVPQLEELDHYRQWTDAAIGNGQTTCPFSYSGPLTETVLLGNVAHRAARALAWDAARLDAGSAEANAFVRREYRQGWEL